LHTWPDEKTTLADILPIGKRLHCNESEIVAG
jgi:hypothetical protein